MGLGGGGGSAPEAPDPFETAQAQAQFGKDTSIWNSALNNVNQITPYGSLSYTLGDANYGGNEPTYDMDAYNAAMASYGGQQGGPSLYRTQDGRVFDSASAFREFSPSSYQQYDPNTALDDSQVSAWGLTSMGGGGTAPQMSDFQTGGSGIVSQYGDLPQWTSRVELSPEMQNVFDSQMRQQQQLGGLAENALGQVESAYSNPYSYDNIQSLYGSDDLNAARTRTEEALFSRLNPQFERDEEAMRTRLINQGIGQNSEAYNREMNRFNESKNDARMQAVLAGGAESDRALQQSMSLRQQGISELDRLRQQPLNEYLAMSGQQQLTTPQFQQYNYGGAPTPDYQSLVNQNYQNQVSQYNADQASSGNALGSLFSLGGSFLGGPAGGAIAGSIFGGG